MEIDRKTAADDLRFPDHVEVLDLLQLADNCLSRSEQIMKRNGATEATLIDLLANALFTIRANYEKKVTCQYFPFAARIVKRRYLYHYRHTPLNSLLSSLWEEIIKLRLKKGLMSMTKNDSIFLKSDIEELREWTRLILGDAEIQDQIESGEMPVEERDNFISGKQAREAEIHIGKQIIKALQIKISEWQAAKEKLPS